MRCSGTPRLYPVLLILAAVAVASALTVVSPLTRSTAHAGCSASSPCPTPVNAFLSLDVTAGGPTTVINVTGGQFLPDEDMTLYWDSPTKVAGTARTDGNGNLTTRVRPFTGDPAGLHKLCANVPPGPCAFFTLEAESASPSPSGSPSDSPLPSASPDQTPSTAATPARISPSLSGFDVISRPPFVFLPIFGIGALLLSLAYWAFSVMRRPRSLAPMPSAAVVHRATRPDYSAGFGSPPPAPSPAPQPSAWNEPMRYAPRAAAAPGAESTAAQAAGVDWGQPVEWGTGSGGWGIAEPPPQEEEAPEAPPPAD